MIEVTKKVKKVVEETVNYRLETYWLLRVIKEDGLNKVLMGEKEFDHEPSEDEIESALSEFISYKCFCSVLKNYRLVESVE